MLLVDIEKNVVYDETVFSHRQLKHQEAVKAELERTHADIVATMNASYEFFRTHPADIQREWVGSATALVTFICALCTLRTQIDDQYATLHTTSMIIKMLISRSVYNLTHYR
jgi:hypothetical protein